MHSEDSSAENMAGSDDTPDLSSSLDQAEQLSASQNDFKVALVLLSIGLALLWYTFGFPMSGSYAGVENQWYISPALFPLMICGLLILCSTLLLIKAIQQGGTSQLLNIKGWIGDWHEQRVRDRWYVIWTLLIFVFAFIPSIDFYLASVIFLLSLTCRFYNETRFCLVLLPLIHIVLAVALAIIKLNINAYEDTTWLTVNQDATVITYSDAAASVAILTLFILSWFQPLKRNLTLTLTQGLVVLIVPLVLVITFTFLLYVPAPVEYGTVSNFLSYVVYDLLAIQ